ncbi:glycosyltransferase [Algicella marina]|uniref:Glycosyltransferase family 1 protein n=1 Tax=Algicella marina TaxID=2683284 RepID=A0A6P1T103_9RHOB|nr:glycosyltransferase [Algicella marina]QHQ36418.1 glycosyltransferase family 1 protein [Algicella marina]
MASLMFFAADISEVAQLRRIRAYRDLGHEVASVGMSKRACAVEWRHLSFGRIGEQRLWRRASRLVMAMPRLWWLRRQVAACDLLIARNLDMGVLALAARLLAGRRVPLVYECLDIHGLLSGRGVASRLARWVERRLLARAAVLVTSSGGFIDGYFRPVQGHDGQWLLLENKLSGPLPPRPAPGRRTGPLVLGWVGALRCGPSFALLCAVADAMPEVRIEMRGRVHAHALPGFHAAVAARPNMAWRGEYAWPEGLAAAYAGLDMVWAQDLWQRGANSDLLLPNRIYEASWFGCPSLAVAGTETGRRVADDGLGWVVGSAEAVEVVTLLRGLDRTELAARRAALLARPDRDFAQMPEDLAVVVKAALGGPQMPLAVAA